MRNVHAHTVGAACCALEAGETIEACCVDEDMSLIYVATSTGDVAAFGIPDGTDTPVRPPPCLAARLPVARPVKQRPYCPRRMRTPVRTAGSS
jgi:hypothetical protein